MINTSPQKIVFITGTPGVGKSTVSSMVQKKISGHLIKVNDLAEKKNLFQGKDPLKGFKIIDIDSFCKEFKSEISNLSGIIYLEGHLSHLCSECDLVIVLRLNPEILKFRLEKRGYGPLKVQENLEAEALGVCLQEAYMIHTEKVQEIDSSELNPEEISIKVVKIIKGLEKFPPGKVDYLNWLIKK